MFAGLADVVATPKDARDTGARWGKKPTTGMYDYIKQELQAKGRSFAPSQTLMVGDQLLKDVLFGKRAHMRTVLVEKFGEHDHPTVEKYQREHEQRLLIAMGFTAVGDSVQFPQGLVTSTQWIRDSKSGLLMPKDLA